MLVASFDPAILRNEGTQIVAKLWANEISAEVAVDSRSLEDLQAKYAKDQHSWVVIIKQDSILKVKSMIRKEQQDTDMHTSQLIAYIKGEIRERDQLHGTYERARPQRHGSHSDTAMPNNHDQEVSVLVAETRSKKTNRRNIVEQAQEKAASLVHSFLDGPSKFPQLAPHHLLTQPSRSNRNNRPRTPHDSRNKSLRPRKLENRSSERTDGRAEVYKGSS